MKTYSAYIVDDEPLAIKTLRKKLEGFKEIQVVGESTRMAKAIFDIKANPPDILFLDIQLAEGNGFDLLNKLNYSGKVIFITAFDEYAFRAFEVNALDYLLKPISHERLKAAVNRIKDSYSENFLDDFNKYIKYNYSDRILVMDRSLIRFILLESVTIIGASRDYTTIETLDGKKSLIMRSMNEWESRLPQEHFVRIHRSYIVNINHIEKIVRNSTSSAKVFLKNHPEPLALSRNYYKNVKSKYL
jgi:two-component system LytT family response regulator